MAARQYRQDPADLPGATDLGGGRVRFALLAPRKRRVAVIGDFNGWKPGADLLREAGRGLWTLTRLLPIGRHRYQFVVDGGLVICDPYARAVEDDFTGAVPRAVVEVGRRAYRWRHEPWDRPHFRDLIYYELHVGDFTPEGTLRGLIERLDYLHDLGVNALELMPVAQWGRRVGWGYDPLYFFAVHAPYGTADDLKELIDQAHARSMAVVLDLVLPHTGVDHPFMKLYPQDRSPWYGHTIGEPNQFNLPKLDHTKAATRLFCRHVQQYWLREFHLDGFRYDYLPAIGIRARQGMPAVVADARMAQNDAFLTGEYIPEDPSLVNRTQLDGAWHVRFSHAVKALLCRHDVLGTKWRPFARTMKMLEGAHEGYRRPSQMVNYVDNHDEVRLIVELCAGSRSDRTLYEKLSLAAILLMVAPGEPLLYHGEEWGQSGEKRINLRNPLRWDGLVSNHGRRMHRLYRRLCHLRREHPALRCETCSIDLLNARQRTLVMHRWDDEDHVVTAMNFSDRPQKLAVPLPPAPICTWREVLTNTPLPDIGKGPYRAELPAWSARIFVGRIAICHEVGTR